MRKTLIIIAILAVCIPCGATLPQAWCDTLSGKNKVDLEKRFMEELLAFTPRGNRPRPDNLRRIGQFLYLSENGWYEKESIRNAAYFKRYHFTYSPLCESAAPAESVITLLNGYTGKKNYIVHLQQHRYGYTLKETDVPLIQLLEYCMSKGCTPYVGIVSQEGDYVSATLFLPNPEDGYCHTFRFHVEKKLLDLETGFFQAEAYTYTPIDNLKQ